MSTSTDGQISYGIYFEEGYEFPWGEEGEWEGDIDEWWLVESGWKWSKQKPYDNNGNYTSGISKGHPLIEEYFDSRHAWKRANPCPVVQVNYQSGEVLAYILAIPSSVLTARRGYPEVFSPNSLIETEEMKKTLIEFCKKYEIEHDTDPCWYLSSYWG